MKSIWQSQIGKQDISVQPLKHGLAVKFDRAARQSLFPSKDLVLLKICI